MMKTAEHDNKDLWVFAYGSLMWRPGFSFSERVPARLIGLHRALCVFSFVHRGTPERPGLVLGLDRGGMCRGIAYRVAAATRAQTLQYLRAREQVTTVYVETMRQIELEEPARRRVRAVCYICDRSHVQYAGRLTLVESLHHVRQGHGKSGANRDYVLETVRALAVSMACCTCARNSPRANPAAIAGRNSTTIVPGRRCNERRGQNSPELSAAGTQGTPARAKRWTMPGL